MTQDRLKNFFFEFYKLGLILMVLTFPLANRDLFSIFHPKLFPTRVILLILIGASVFPLFLAFLEKTLWSRLRKLLSDKFFLILLLLLFVRTISLVNSLNLKASLSLLSFFTAMVAFYVILKEVTKKDPPFLFKLFKFHIGTVIATAFFGLVQVIFLILGRRLPGVLVGSAFLRIPATFYDANHLPAYLLSALPFVLSLSFLEENFCKRWGFFLLSGIASFILFLTFSRSGLLGFTIALGFYLLFLIKFKCWRKIGLLFSIFVFLLIPVVLSARTELSFPKRILSVLNPAEKSTTAHSLLLSGELYLFYKNPILGVGYGSFNEHFRSSPLGKAHALIDPAVHIRLPTHSIWLETLTETGLLGFVPYLFLMLIILRSLTEAQTLVKNKKYSLYLASFISSFAGILSAGIFYSYNLEFFWFFLFFAYLLGRQIQEGKIKEAKRVEKIIPEKIPWREILPPFFLVSLASLIIFYRLGAPNLLEGKESFLAVLSKSILRNWERGWEKWWMPRFRGEFYPYKFLPFLYLEALAMFFYGITAATARFWSAFFGVGTILGFYFLGRILLDSFWGLILGLFVLSLPPFLAVSKRGEPYTLVLFLLTLVLSFLAFLVKRFGFFAPSFKRTSLRYRQRRLIFRLLLILPFISLILFQSLIFPPQSCKNEVYLVDVRHRESRKGTVPTLVVQPPSTVLMYYSDVPLGWLESYRDLERHLLSKEEYFVIVDGDKFKEMRGLLAQKGVGFNVVAASENLVLIRKYGEEL